MLPLADVAVDGDEIRVCPVGIEQRGDKQFGVVGRAVLAVVDQFAQVRAFLGQLASELLDSCAVGPKPLQDTRRVADQFLGGVARNLAECLVDIHDLWSRPIQVVGGNHHPFAQIGHGFGQ